MVMGASVVDRLPNIGNCGRDISVHGRRMYFRSRRGLVPALEKPDPPLRGVHGSVPIVCGRIDVVEKVPHCK